MRSITLCASSPYIYVFYSTMTAKQLCNQLCIEAVRIFSWPRRHTLYIDASFCSSRTRPTHTDSPTAPRWFSSRTYLKDRHRRRKTEVARFCPLFCDFLKNIIKGIQLRSWILVHWESSKRKCNIGKHLHHSNHSGLCRKVGRSWRLSGNDKNKRTEPGKIMDV